MHAESSDRSLQSRLARLLRFGTMIAVAMTSFGMVAAFTSLTGAATAVAVCGLLTFALLPIAGLVVVVHHYARRLDWTYVALTVIVLVLVGVNFLVGSAA